jgi:transitional endoplasmic reticulum ATPase
MNHNASLLGELMNQLDGLVENHYVVVIATTNKVDALEKALRNRPGRFDRVIDIPPPDNAARLKMLELYANKHKMEDVNLAEIAEKTEKYTGAHIKELVNTAIITAIDENSFDTEGMVILKQEYFTKNIAKVRNKKIQPAIGFGSSKEGDQSLMPYDDNDY